ncbi:MAG: hypothetical protein HGA45_23615, partial [Chloroflexales bacterium]|nr:hypothetical protein [Chloroflexales bacterium]
MSKRPGEPRGREAHDEAEGVLQTTFIKACEALASFDGVSSLGTWIYRIATNEGLMLLRKRKKLSNIPTVRAYSFTRLWRDGGRGGGSRRGKASFRSDVG